MAEIEGLPDDRLRLARLSRGYSQVDLARVAGVTRQAISGIESGRWSPSLEVALALARAFDTSVEELFGEAGEAPSVSARLAVRRSSQDAAPRRVLFSEIAGNTIAFPLSRDGSFVPGFVPALGVVREVTQDGVSARNVDARRIAEAGPTLAVAGCDPAIALLQGPLSHRKPSFGLLWWPCGNATALDLLRRGAVHAAAVHRGASTRPQPRRGVEAVGFAAWREGLALAPRHRKQVKDLRDVVSNKLRIANREPGSEARRLLDDQLDLLGITAGDVSGYETVCTAHLLVTSAIASGLADAAVTTEPASLAFGLEFLPWQEEVCELHIPRSLMGTGEVQALLDVLGGRELARQLATIEGYDPEICGRVVTP